MQDFIVSLFTLPFAVYLLCAIDTDFNQSFCNLFGVQGSELVNWNLPIVPELDLMAQPSQTGPSAASSVGQNVGAVAGTSHQLEPQQDISKSKLRHPNYLYLNVKGRYYINYKTNKKVYLDENLSDSTLTPDPEESDDDDIPPKIPEDEPDSKQVELMKELSTLKLDPSNPNPDVNPHSQFKFSFTSFESAQPENMDIINKVE